ncbi:endonuclease-reverse transcriptase [Plakobranchus ocellatus]|uniref:Endonuclease-reverse transcriptase n=1 Tax=Plakobranchus ocellatus TaxID=259542 RepID=A0AAV4D8S1_9GAST|nr:endonuclease-reverse transcriptase [Plakobranchus ocellatus]
MITVLQIQHQATGVSNHCKDEKYPGHNPFSEPESFNIKYLVESLQNRLDAYVSVHSYSQCRILSCPIMMRVTEWQPRNGKRSGGRQARRWRDDIVKTKENTWSRDARDRDEWKRDVEGYIL